MRVGSQLRSANIGLTYSSLGAYAPDASTRRLGATGGTRWVGARTTLSATWRLSSDHAGASVNPLLAPTVGVRDSAAPGPALIQVAAEQAAMQYMAGATAVFAQNPRWTHSAVVGIDGYRLTNFRQPSMLLSNESQATEGLADGTANRATMRLSSVAGFGDLTGVSGTLTFAAEQSVLRSQTVARTQQFRVNPGTVVATPSTTEDSRTSSGIVTQVNVALRNALFFTSGLRVERTQGFATSDRALALPMFGVAFVMNRENTTLKVRAAYGRGVRPAQTLSRTTMFGAVGGSSEAASLEPERQSGVEAGFDLDAGRHFSLHVTRFDQRATGLIQQVPIARDTTTTAGPGATSFSYVLENIGEIWNRGWELSSSLTARHVTVSGTLSQVDSRVVRVAEGYRGDLRAGDRMLEVPRWTSGLTASWSTARWHASLAASRASEWIGYDRLGLAQAASGLTPGARSSLQSVLRAYWRDYPGVPHLRAAISRDVFRSISLELSGENLLNRQTGEPDNATIVPGRTIIMGLRAKF